MPQKPVKFRSNVLYDVTRIMEDSILYTKGYARARSKMYDVPHECCERCGLQFEFESLVTIMVTEHKGNVFVCRDCTDAIMSGVDDCGHNWVSMVSEFITNGEICTECNSVRG